MHQLVQLDAQPKRKIRLGLAVGKYPPLDYESFQALDAEIEKMFLGENEDK